MRNKVRVQKVIDKIDASVKNLETTVGRTSLYPQVERIIEQVQEYISDLNLLIEVEDESIDNRY